MPGMHQAGLGRECQQRGVLGGNHKFAFLSSLGSHFSRKRDLHSAPVEKRLIEFSSEKDSRWRTSQKRTTFLPGMGMERSRIRPSSKTGAVPYPSLFSEM